VRAQPIPVSFQIFEVAAEHFHELFLQVGVVRQRFDFRMIQHLANARSWVSKPKALELNVVG
jgi:hypothetical protein